MGPPARRTSPQGRGASGGANPGGGRGVDGGLRAPAFAAWAAQERRWVRIWSITDAWVMNATIRIAPRQVGHTSGSTSKICWSRAAHRRLASLGAGKMAGGPSAAEVLEWGTFRWSAAVVGR